MRSYAAFLRAPRKVSSAATKASGFSICGTWPHSGTITTLAPGISLLIGERVLLREHAVVVAPDQQGRHVDAVQPFGQIRIVAARLPGDLGDRGAVLQRDVFQFRPQRACDDVVGLFLIVKEVAQPLLVAAQERIELLDAGDMETGGAGQRERGQPLRAAHGELRGDPAAERQPDQVDVLEFQLVEQVEIEIGEVVDVIEPVRRVGFAKARMFRRDDVELLRQLLHERQDICAGRAMQNDERAAGAATHQPDAAASDRKHRRRKIHHGGSLRFGSNGVKAVRVIPGPRVARRPGIHNHRQ